MRPQYPLLKLPLDENQQFVKSFTIDQKKEYTEFFHTYGFVCIRDILSKEECKACVDDVYSYLESGAWKSSERKTSNIKRDDLSTWENQHWPGMMNEGILGYPPVFTKQSFINRQNPKIYSVFSHLLQRKDLWVSIDRYGFFRPTKGVMINGKKVDRIDWKTEPNIHLDMNPWWYYDNTSTSKPDAGFFKSYKILDKFCLEYNHSGKASDNQLKLQGLLNFIDNRVEDGVPGFHKHLEDWTKKTRPKFVNYFNSFNVIPLSDPMQKQAQRVPLLAGSLLVWDYRLPHGSKPNNSDRPRMAQFFKMFPAPPLIANRMEILAEKMEKCGFKPSELGMKLFGLKEWEKE